MLFLSCKHVKVTFAPKHIPRNWEVSEFMSSFMLQKLTLYDRIIRPDRLVSK